MRILVVSNLYPSPAHPGFGTFVEARVAALESAGAEVQVEAIRDPAVHRRVAAKYASLAIRSGRAAVVARLRRRRIDVVEAHIAYPTGLLARPVAALLGAPLVLFAHGADILTIPARSRRHAQLARSTVRAADLIVANSAFLAGEIARRYPSVTDRVRVLTPGIELDLFTAAPDVSTRAGILFVGRLIPEKGADVLIRAIAALRADGAHVDQVTIVGTGPERERLSDLAASLAVDVRMTGDLGRVAVADAMRQALVTVVPSVYREPLGLVALEAMAAGSIVVASATGGLTESVVDRVTGLTAPPGDTEALARAIERGLRLAGDPVAGAEMRSNALAMAATHDVRRAAEVSLDWYGTLRR